MRQAGYSVMATACHLGIEEVAARSALKRANERLGSESPAHDAAGTRAPNSLRSGPRRESSYLEVGADTGTFQPKTVLGWMILAFDRFAHVVLRLPSRRSRLTIAAIIPRLLGWVAGKSLQVGDVDAGQLLHEQFGTRPHLSHMRD